MEETAERLRPLYDVAVAARDAGDFPSLESAARQLLTFGAECNDPKALAWGHYFLGVCRMNYNDADGAENELGRARTLFEATGDRFDAARVMTTLAAVKVDIRLEIDEGRRLLDFALPVIGESGDLHLFAIALGNFGELVRLEGDYRRALQCCGDAAAIFSELGDATRAGYQLANVALTHALLRDFPAALDDLDRAYEYLQRDLNPRWIAWHLDVCFIVVARMHIWDVAARLYGLADLFRDEVDLTRPQAMMPWFSQAVERVTQYLERDVLHQLVSEGEKLSLEGAHLLLLTCKPDSH